MVKAACLQTGLGMLPTDWGTAAVKDILQLRRGRVISHRDILKAPGPYPVYSSQTYDNGVMGSIASYDFEGEYITWTTDGANAGTVFFRSGRFNCTNVCGTGRPINPSQTSACFFAYYLGTVAWKHVSHVGNPKLMSGPFGDIPVVIPPAVAQRAIADALSDADALIAALDALIAKKCDLKQAAMQQLLTGKTRLPGFTGEWKRKPLHQICSMKSGKQIHLQKIDTHSAFPCYGGNGHRGFASHYTHDGTYCIVGRQGALCGNVLAVEGKFFASEHAVVVTSGEKTDVNWLAFVLQRMNLNQYSESSAQPGLSVVKLLLLEVLTPPQMAEQSAIAAILSDMDAELAGLQYQRDKARAIKQGMMQELLTGRIRLI